MGAGAFSRKLPLFVTDFTDKDTFLADFMVLDTIYGNFCLFDRCYLAFFWVLLVHSGYLDEVPFSILSFFFRCLVARDKMPISRSRVPPVNPLQLENIYPLIKLSEEIEEQRYESACQDIQVSLLGYIGQLRSAC